MFGNKLLNDFFLLVADRDKVYFWILFHELLQLRGHGSTWRAPRRKAFNDLDIFVMRNLVMLKHGFFRNLRRSNGRHEILQLNEAANFS